MQELIIISVLAYALIVTADGCAYMPGCVSCMMQQPGLSAPRLPAGYTPRLQLSQRLYIQRAGPLSEGTATTGVTAAFDSVQSTAAVTAAAVPQAVLGPSRNLLQDRQQGVGSSKIGVAAPPAAQYPMDMLGSGLLSSAPSLPSNFDPSAPGPEQQVLSILTSDPKNTTRPHPWDVLLFKATQFNTTRPAYRLGGLGLMLMQDFSASKPFTDWHEVGVGNNRPSGSQQWWGSLASSPGGSMHSSSLASAAARLSAGSAAQSQLQQRLGGLLAHIASAVHTGLQQLAPTDSRDAIVSTADASRMRLAEPSAANTTANATMQAAAAQPIQQLWCTVCSAPTYTLSPYGTCVCASGYGRILDSSTPYACLRCPAGQVSVSTAVLGQQATTRQDVRLAGQADASTAAAAANKLVLNVCKACPAGTVPNAEQTQCTASAL